MKHLQRPLAVIAVGVFCSTASAAPGLLNHGGQFSSGGVTTGRTMPLVTGNPSLLPIALKKDQRFRMSAAELPAFAVEFGPVDNFTDSIDRVEEILDEEAENADTREEFEQLAREANALLRPVGDAAYLNLDLAAQVPLLPMLLRVGSGAVSLHADVTASGRANVLFDDFRIVSANDRNQACPAQSDDCDIATDSAVLLRSGIFARVGLGYGQEVMKLPIAGLAPDGALFVGGRLSIIQGQMGRTLARVDGGDEEDANGDDSLERAIDNFDRTQQKSTGVGGDVGVSWVSKNAQLGLTVRNLIAPSFDFATLGENCTALADEARSDCESAAVFVQDGRLESRSKFSMKAQPMAEASVRLVHELRLISSVELTAVETVGGDDYQNFFVGLNYEGPWWLPGLRGGYQSNLAGTKQSAATFGFTLFGFLNADALYGLNKAQFDGESYPRSAAVRVGFAVPFK